MINRIKKAMFNLSKGDHRVEDTVSIKELLQRKLELTERLEFAQATQAAMTAHSLKKEIALVDLAIAGHKSSNSCCSKGTCH